VLTLAVLLAGVNAAWGEETIIWEGTSQQLVLSGNVVDSKFPATTDDTSSLRIYVGKGGLQALCAGWGNAILKGQSGNGGIESADNTYYNEDNNCYQIPFSACIDNLVNSLKSNGLVAQIRDYNTPQNITKISVFTPSGPADPFLNEAAEPCATTNGNEEIARDLTTKTINLFGASLAGVKYARIYLANDKGKAVDPTGLLSVKYGVTDATQATTDAKNGFYIYNGGELTKSDISITLNAEAGNFTKYKIVALLSNDLLTATPSDGTSPLTQEPKWQEEYS
jgi:hypothetical protein